MKIKLSFLIFAIASVFLCKGQIPTYVPLSGLQGYWPFNGNANDLSSNGNNGTVNGASLTTDRFNLANKAYSFNGINSFISTNYAGILGGNPRAVAFWMKSQATIATPAVTWGGDAQGTRFDCGFNYIKSGVTMDIADAATTYAANSNVSGNVWHHYVFQFSNANLSQVAIFQDGVLISSVAHTFNQNTPINTSNDTPVFFGALFTPPNYFFNGQLDEIGIWNRTLTKCEILQLYNSSLPAVNIAATNTNICIGQTVSLTASGASSYTWNIGNVGPNLYLSPQSNVVVSVSGTNTLGCVGTKSLQINVFNCVGVADITLAAEHISIYPNPTTGFLTCETAFPFSSIQIFNAYGEVVYRLDNWAPQIEIDLSHLARGFYFAKIKYVEKEIIKKIEKQ